MTQPGAVSSAAPNFLALMWLVLEDALGSVKRQAVVS